MAASMELKGLFAQLMTRHAAGALGAPPFVDEEELAGPDREHVAEFPGAESDDEEDLAQVERVLLGTGRGVDDRAETPRAGRSRSPSDTGETERARKRVRYSGVDVGGE